VRRNKFNGTSRQWVGWAILVVAGQLAVAAPLRVADLAEELSWQTAPGSTEPFTADADEFVGRQIRRPTH